MSEISGKLKKKKNEKSNFVRMLLQCFFSVMKLVRKSRVTCH
jgi:hypothetical protein